MRDHPRSRGVYAVPTTSDQWDEGSSPLARGLQSTRAGIARRARIIPARAGFTEYRRLRRTRSRDHPRSRGVYRWWDQDEFVWAGSSPLARGLRRPRPAAFPETRIIPARAGFTSSLGRWRASPPDHPRSRGVYLRADAACRLREGSSPLARGLPVVVFVDVVVEGIIPARAGFTPPWTLRRVSSGDHPRSRGVYEYHRHTTRSPSGSSPLARGLQMHSFICISLSRIIPARAGFTF